MVVVGVGGGGGFRVMPEGEGAWPTGRGLSYRWEVRELVEVSLGGGALRLFNVVQRGGFCTQMALRVTWITWIPPTANPQPPPPPEAAALRSSLQTVGVATYSLMFR